MSDTPKESVAEPAEAEDWRTKSIKEAGVLLFREVYALRQKGCDVVILARHPNGGTVFDTGSDENLSRAIGMLEAAKHIYLNQFLKGTR